MSMRHLAAVLCISSNALLWTSQTMADDRTPLPATPGTSQAGDVNYSSNSDPSSEDDGSAVVSNNSDGSDHPKWQWISGVEATYLDVVLHPDLSLGMNAGSRIWVGVENRNEVGSQSAVLAD